VLTSARSLGSFGGAGGCCPALVHRGWIGADVDVLYNCGNQYTVGVFAPKVTLMLTLMLA